MSLPDAAVGLRISGSVVVGSSVCGGALVGSSDGISVAGVVGSAASGVLLEELQPAKVTAITRALPIAEHLLSCTEAVTVRH